MSRRVVVTTSWDDGHVLDTKLAALLDTYGLKGTFYVSPHDREFSQADLLAPAAVKKLSAKHEIGAHTMTHPRVTNVSDAEAKAEMQESKEYLEALIGKPVTTFCYPGGNYHKKHAKMAADIGFAYTRTVKRHTFNRRGMLHEAETTVNAYSHLQDAFKILRFARYNPLKFVRYMRWDVLAMAMFDRIMETGGVFHLWGHSWEVDAHGDWDRLETVLAYISRKKDVSYVTNGELPHKAPINLLMAAPYYPPHLGGQEFYAQNIARQLMKTGHYNVTVATSGGRGFYKPKRVVQKDGIVVYALPYWLKLSNTPLNPLWFFSLRAIMRREYIDCVNVHAPVTSMADVLFTKTPTILTYHMLSMKKGIKYVDVGIGLYEKHLLPRLIRRAAYVLCSSQPVQEVFLKPYLQKSDVVTPGVDTERFKPENRTAQGGRTLLFNGSLTKLGRHKGLDYLLHAMVALTKEYPDMQLVVVGVGDALDEYRGMATELGLADNVQFMGGVYDEDLVAQYMRADVYVHPSLNDSYPLALLEAMASGLAIVASRVGGIPTIVQDGVDAMLVEPGNATVIAEAVRTLMTDTALARKLGDRARKKAESTLDWSVRARRTDEIIHEVLAEENT